MAAQTPTNQQSAPHDVHAHHTGLLVTLVGVLALALGFGAGWAIFASSSPLTADEVVRAPSHTPSGIQAEATNLLNNFWAAWEAGDTAQLESLMTADGAFVDVRDCAGATVSGGGVAGCVAFHPGSYDPAVDPVILSDGPPYAAAQIVMANMAPEGTPGGDPASEYFAGVNTLTIFVLDQESGVLKIKEFRVL